MNIEHPYKYFTEPLFHAKKKAAAGGRRRTGFIAENNRQSMRETDAETGAGRENFPPFPENDEMTAQENSTARLYISRKCRTSHHGNRAA